MDFIISSGLIKIIKNILTSNIAKMNRYNLNKQKFWGVLNNF